VADSQWEALINGQKRGVSPKHRFNSKFRCGPCALFVSVFTISNHHTARYSQRFPYLSLPAPLSAFLVTWCPSVSACLRLHNTPLSFHRESISYHKVKQTATTYQAAKQSLLGPSAPFAGWIVSGEEWESFDAHGELPSDVRTPLS